MPGRSDKTIGTHPNILQTVNHQTMWIHGVNLSGLEVPSKRV